MIGHEYIGKDSKLQVGRCFIDTVCQALTNAFVEQVWLSVVGRKGQEVAMTKFIPRLSALELDVFSIHCFGLLPEAPNPTLNSQLPAYAQALWQTGRRRR